MSRNPRPQPGTPGDANKRRHGRVRLQDVVCSLGEVLDLSASGMRVRMKGKPPAVGARFCTKLEDGEQAVEVCYLVSWAKRSGFFKHEVGLKFDGLSDMARQFLCRLARSAAHNEVIRPSIEEARRAAEAEDAKQRQERKAG